MPPPGMDVRQAEGLFSPTPRFGGAVSPGSPGDTSGLCPL